MNPENSAAPRANVHDEPHTARHYWAFISYSHADERDATWLHKALERYRFPKRLRGRQTSIGRVPPRRWRSPRRS
jgi:hypothetical protein